MAKSFKWDSKAVISAVGKVKADLLRQTAVDVRRTAKRSMKKAKKNAKNRSSMPGKPPNVHTGGLKNSIRYAYDAKRQSAVIGPIKYKGKSKGARALEKGGSVQATVFQKTGTVVERKNQRDKTSSSYHYKPMSERSRKERAAINKYYGNWTKKAKRVTFNVKIKKRPVMLPALQKELKNTSKRLQRAAKKFNK